MTHPSPPGDIVERLRSMEPCQADDWKIAREAADEIDDLNRTFDLMHEANMRGVAMWRQAHPGSDLVLPDQAKLVEWLLSELDRRAQPASAGTERDVELAARAMCERPMSHDLATPRTWKETSEHYRDFYRELARAALSALPSRTEGPQTNLSTVRAERSRESTLDSLSNAREPRTEGRDPATVEAAARIAETCYDSADVHDEDQPEEVGDKIAEAIRRALASPAKEG